MLVGGIDMSDAGQNDGGLQMENELLKELNLPASMEDQIALVNYVQYCVDLYYETQRALGMIPAASVSIGIDQTQLTTYNIASSF